MQCVRPALSYRKHIAAMNDVLVYKLTAWDWIKSFQNHFKIDIYGVGATERNLMLDTKWGIRITVADVIFDLKATAKRIRER